MKVERWEEENDEEWADRLAEEIVIADNAETTKYFFQSGYEEDEIILNYVGVDSWTWKEHPEGPFKARQIMEWKRCYDVVVPTLQIKVVDLLGEIRELLQSSTQTPIEGEA